MSDVETAYSVHKAAIARFVWGLLRDDDLVADVLQIAFVRLLEREDEVDPQKLRAWLFRVAYNEALSIRRKESIQQRRHQDFARSKPTQCLDRIGEGIERVEEQNVLRSALSQLDEEHRQLVYLRITDGKTFAEIARTLRIPLGTVLSRMRAAIGRLRNLLEND